MTGHVQFICPLCGKAVLFGSMYWQLTHLGDTCTSCVEEHDLYEDIAVLVRVLPEFLPAVDPNQVAS